MSLYIEESIIPVFAQAAMYGLYIGTSAQCLRWLLLDDKDWNIRKKINWTMLTIAIFIFILMTINLWTSFQMTVAFDLQVNMRAGLQSWMGTANVRVFRDITCSLGLDWRLSIFIFAERNSARYPPYF
jgi:hypothetical protein